MTQSYEDFKQRSPKIAEAMEMLGVSYEELRRLYAPPRIFTGNATTANSGPIQWPFVDTTTNPRNK